MAGPAASLYVGATRHARHTPFAHSFKYRIFSLLLDIDRISEAARRARLFSYNAPGLLSFYDRDHGARDGSSLRLWAEEQFHAAGVDVDGAIKLLCFPRLFGFVFNPLSIFFGYSRTGDLKAVIYEVNNTFGETHAYVIEAGSINEDGAVRQEVEKTFYVSPFFPDTGAYDFRIAPPGDDLNVFIKMSRGGEKHLTATMEGVRKPFSDAALAKAWLGNPLMTLKVVAAIHWEALHLWRKGATYFKRRPKPNATASVGRTISLPK